MRGRQTAHVLPPGIQTGAHQHRCYHERRGRERRRPAEAALANPLPFLHARHANRGIGGFGCFDELRNLRRQWIEGALQLADNLFFVETQQAGVLDDEAPGEDAAGELVELTRFNGLQKSRRDLEFLGDLSQFEIALQAFAAQSLANGSHTGGVPAFRPIIQQGPNQAGPCLALLA
jgi:hypothetical protein